MITHPDFANPVLSKDEAHKILQPYFEKFLTCINKAWAIWLSDPNRHMLDNRARAAFVNSVIVYLAKEAFAPDAPKVRFKTTKGAFYLFVSDHTGLQTKLRFKKFKSNGTYSNLMTGEQLRLIEQRSFEGMVPTTYLTVGYQLNKVQQEIEARKVTLQSKSAVIYEIDLDEAVASAPDSPQIPVIAPPPPPPPTDSRARAKKEAKPKEQREETK